jgi:uncharacterized protein (TIGR00255 family)
MLETRLRAYLSERIVHGKVEAWLRVRELDAPVAANADIAAAKAVSSVIGQVAEACGLVERVSLSTLIGFEGVVSFEREIDEATAWDRIFPELEACFADYESARLSEGAATKLDLEAQLSRVSASLSIVRAQVPEIERTVREQLRTRFKEAMGESLDEGRILSEIASALMKYTINEELARLAAHAASFTRIMDEEASPGKKLDFLCQEMNREVNTIGSKSMLLVVSQTVVELKDAIENLREQLRNIE